MEWLFWIALATLGVWIAVGTDLALGNRSIPFLSEIPPELAGERPSVSIIIAARDEEEDLEAALRSVLGQEHPSLEVLAVDDRSTDATARILDRMAAGNPRLEVLHITELPDGWLGKTHALHRGATACEGELYLFADADVAMRPGALRSAVARMQREELDHLTAVPELVNPGRLLEAITGAFKLMFGLYYRPWKAADPGSARFVGTGAFNLVRASAYRAAGGHASIALCPDDDLMLGRLLKRSGFRQALVFAPELLRVEWYASLAGMVKGLEKNSFAAADYSLLRLAGGTILVLVLVAWPVAALFVTGGATLWLNAAVLVAMCGLYADNARFYGGRPLYAPVVPFAALFLLFVAWRSALLALATGRITWRGTDYSLEELRRFRR